MVSLHLEPDNPLSPALNAAVGGAISEFIDAHRPMLAQMSPRTSTLADLAAEFTAGGKRMRPAFCFWGAVAASGTPADPEPLVRAAASLDLLHVSALVHDDVMDASDTRRGVPAAHRQMETRHRDGGWLGDSARFGQAGAILLGDLLTMWSVELFDESGLPPEALERARPLLQAVRTEVTCGQYLDVLMQHQPMTDPQQSLADANNVVEHKTARYTVQRPVQIGAALGGGSQRLADALAAYGSPLGRAFQFRDDLLGVFGDEATTGKPAGDDLREGKRTVLVAQAYAGSRPAGRERLAALLGRADLDAAGIDEARTIISDSGAAQQVEAMIESGLSEALAAIDADATGSAMTAEGREALTALAYAAVRREH